MYGSSYGASSYGGGGGGGGGNGFDNANTFSGGGFFMSPSSGYAPGGASQDGGIRPMQSDRTLTPVTIKQILTAEPSTTECQHCFRARTHPQRVH